VRPSPLGTGGRIIFVSATIHYRAMPFQAHVAVAKAGIDALSHTVSIEYGPLGVTSNIIAPGPIASTEVVFFHLGNENEFIDIHRASTASSPPT
jgi:peroxisomal 2,4-dienoyl-CoA reductase